MRVTVVRVRYTTAHVATVRALAIRLVCQGEAASSRLGQATGGRMPPLRSVIEPPIGGGRAGDPPGGAEAPTILQLERKVFATRRAANEPCPATAAGLPPNKGGAETRVGRAVIRLFTGKTSRSR